MFLFLSLKPLSIHLLHLFFFNRFVIVKNSCCSSVTKLCPTLGNLINCSTPGFSVHDCLPEFAQTHVHWVSDAIQPSSAIPFSPCLQSFPESGSFPISRLVASGGQSIGASASTLVLPMNIQCWFPLGLTSLSSMLSKELSRVFSRTRVQKHQFFGAQPSLWSTSHYRTWLLEKIIALTIWTYVGQMMSLLFNTLSAFLKMWSS